MGHGPPPKPSTHQRPVVVGTLFMSESQDDRPSVTVTSDGAARGNPGPGGWAALLQRAAKEKLLSGEHPADTTNNAMELLAAISALEALNRPCRVILRADSTYVLEGLKRILAGSGPLQKNRALWERLAAAARAHDIIFEWVKGHAGDSRNERVDEAANAAAARAYATAESQRAVARPSFRRSPRPGSDTSAARRPLTCSLRDDSH